MQPAGVRGRQVLCGLLKITQPGSSLSCLVMACCGIHSVADGAHGAGGTQQSLCCGSLHGCGDRPGTRGLPAHRRAAVPGTGQGRLPTLSINQSIATQHSLPHPATGSGSFMHLSCCSTPAISQGASLAIRSRSGSGGGGESGDARTGLELLHNDTVVASVVSAMDSFDVACIPLDTLQGLLPHLGPKTRAALSALHPLLLLLVGY